MLCLLKKEEKKSAQCLQEFDFWIHFRCPWFIKAPSCLSSLCWNPLQSSDALIYNFSSIICFLLLLPHLLFIVRPPLSRLLFLRLTFPSSPYQQTGQPNGNVLSNQECPSWSHACGGQTESGSFAHAGQTLSSHFGEIVRHHAAVLAAEPRRHPASPKTAHRGSSASSSSTSHHRTEAGAPHGGVDELLRDAGGGKRRQKCGLPKWKLQSNSAKGKVRPTPVLPSDVNVNVIVNVRFIYIAHFKANGWPKCFTE